VNSRLLNALVWGKNRSERQLLSAHHGYFVLGAVLGGLLSATALVILGAIAGIVPLVVRQVALFGLIAVMVIGGPFRLEEHLPQAKRQVPQAVLRRPVGFLQFGFELGLGTRTYVVSTAPYIAAGSLFLVSAGEVAPAAGLGVAWGLARGMSSLTPLPPSNARSPEALVLTTTLAVSALCAVLLAAGR